MIPELSEQILQMLQKGEEDILVNTLTVSLPAVRTFGKNAGNVQANKLLRRTHREGHWQS